ncbi:Autophagy-related protein 17 [Leucoagaricus sp. SymC.cos]|nr:Autophagy-related protein 17 [Leucoagaricus sp. SymC.cos]
MSSSALAQDQPHLVSLVLQSKKALQRGQQLCSHAHMRSNASSRAAIDVLALDAKVRWMTEAVMEQLKLAVSVAKSFEEKRTSMHKQAQAWDATRSHYTNELEHILEALGAQLVPPEFHQTSTDSSLFGSQHSDQDDQPDQDTFQGQHSSRVFLPPSPSATVRNHSGVLTRGTQAIDHHQDRKHWKNLRDFVDDQAIEDILETIENNRIALDDLLGRTDDYPETLTRAIEAIRSSLPEPTMESSLVSRMQDALVGQDTVATSMANLLESLASHYEQIDTALKDTEAGEIFSEEDLQQMHRDVEELPAILSEIEESGRAIDGHHEFLLSTQESLIGNLVILSGVLDDLEELGDIMGEMLQNQEEVEVKCQEDLNSLHEQILTIRDLHERYVSYQTAFNKLIIEIARRRHYKEAAENIVKGMMSQLTAMTEEEDQVRRLFNAEYGVHLPEDICLCIGNPPTKWEVVPLQGDTLEVLPHIDEDLLSEVRIDSFHIVDRNF